MSVTSFFLFFGNFFFETKVNEVSLRKTPQKKKKKKNKQTNTISRHIRVEHIFHVLGKNSTHASASVDKISLFCFFFLPIPPLAEHAGINSFSIYMSHSLLFFFCTYPFLQSTYFFFCTFSFFFVLISFLTQTNLCPSGFFYFFLLPFTVNCKLFLLPFLTVKSPPSTSIFFFLFLSWSNNLSTTSTHLHHKNHKNKNPPAPQESKPTSTDSVDPQPPISAASADLSQC